VAPYQRTEPAQYAPPTQQPYGVPGRAVASPQGFAPATFDAAGVSRAVLPTGIARHAASGPEDPRARGLLPRTAPMRRKGFQWLLAIPIIMPLLVPLYNRVNPALLGIPFFYWYQLGCAVVAIAVITFVYLVTKGRS
jgi:hypothetical protein